MAHIHAVEIFFDPASDKRLRQVWAEIAGKAGVIDHMAQLPDSRPHVSLAVFGEAKLDLVEAALKGLAAEQAPFELRLDSLGTFEGAGALFFGPTSNRRLLDLQQRCYDRLHGLVEGWEDYYLPERLVFHCTLNIGLTREELLRAVAAAMDVPLPIRVRAEGLGLVRIPQMKILADLALQG